MLAALGTGGPVVASNEHGRPLPLMLSAMGKKRRRHPGPQLHQRIIGSLHGAKLLAPGETSTATATPPPSSVRSANHLRFDATFDDLWRMGVAGGYTQSSLNVNARLSSGSVGDAYHFALYGGGQLGALGLRTGAAYSWDNIQTTRTIAFAGGSCCRLRFRFQRSDDGRLHGWHRQVFGEAGWAMSLGNVATEPFAGLAWVHLNSDGFSETGGAAALTAASGPLTQPSPHSACGRRCPRAGARRWHCRDGAWHARLATRLR